MAMKLLKMVFIVTLTKMVNTKVVCIRMQTKKILVLKILKSYQQQMWMVIQIRHRKKQVLLH